MDSAIIVALISLLGTLVGTFTGIWTSSRLTLYRIEQLEKKMDRFASIEEKLNKLELHNAVQDERTDAVTQDVAELKKR